MTTERVNVPRTHTQAEVLAVASALSGEAFGGNAWIEAYVKAEQMLRAYAALLGSEPVAYQRRDLGCAHPQLGTRQWSHWREIGRAEYIDVIEYKTTHPRPDIELRALIPHPAKEATI